MREMSFTLEAETQIYLLSILLGVGISIVYDFFRAVRALFRHKSWLVAAEDIVFSALAGFAVFTFATELTGKLRMFTLFGMAAGFVLWHFSAGNLIIFVFRKAVGWLKRRFIKPLGSIIHKIGQKMRPRFVKNHVYLNKNKKISQKPLKVDF